MNNINTDSIKLLISSSKEKNFDKIKEITINRFSIDLEIQNVDMNDLKNFVNLEKLTLVNLNLSYNDFVIIMDLKKLSELKLINCEIVEPIYDLLNSLQIKTLFLDNINVNISFMYLNIYMLTIRNMNYEENNIVTDILDISKAIYDMKDIKNVNTKKLIINHSKYIENKKYFELLSKRIHIVVKEDNYDFTEVEL